jgi:hypothetical protein
MEGGVIEGAGLGDPLLHAGVPSDGTTEIQTITVTPDTSAGGTYKLSYEGFVTAALADTATAAQVQAALRALPSIGSAGVTVTGSTGGPYTITFGGNLVKLDVSDLLVETEDGVGVVQAVDTPGVTATQREAALGALLHDTTNRIL